MNKLTVLGLLSVALSSTLYADEYISDKYYEEVTSYTHGEIISDSYEPVSVLEETEVAMVNEENTTLISLLEHNHTDMPIDEEPSKEFDIYLNALKEAKTTGKIIILAVRSTECPYCDKMDQETLTDENVKSVLEKDFLMLHYNQDLEELPLGLHDGMTPNFIFVDKDENIINQYPGMRTPEEFISALEEILAQ